MRFTQKLCFSKDYNIARSYSIKAVFARGNIREFMVRNETGIGGEPFWYYSVQCGLYSGLRRSLLVGTESGGNV